MNTDEHGWIHGIILFLFRIRVHPCPSVVLKSYRVYA
jgi:hypothetical protein